MTHHQINSPAAAALEEQKLLAAQYEADEHAKTLRISKEEIESAEDLSRRSAKMKDVRRVRLLHEDPSRLNAAARAAAESLGLAPVLRLPPSRHNVYAIFRTPVVKGYAGLRASAKDICFKLGMKLRTFWHALRDLRRLGLINFTKNYETNGPYSCIKTRRTYKKMRAENTYTIGYKAPQRDYKLALTAEGRAGSNGLSPDVVVGVSSPPSTKTTEVCTTPPCKNGAATTRLRRGGENPTTTSGEKTLEPALASPGDDEGRADRADFLSTVRSMLDRPRARVSTGEASEAKNGVGASSGPTRDTGEEALGCTPNEFFASIRGGWEPAT